MKESISFLVAMMLFILGISLGFMLAFTSTATISTLDSIDIDEIEKTDGGSTLLLPAVNQRGEGVTTKLHVSTKNGTGRALVDIDHMIFWGDTQESIQISRAVASQVTKSNFSDIDITYSVQTPATLIEGQSAGAALTVATIAAIENRSLPDNVIITGTVNRDGTIGQVGGIKEKAEASRQAGADVFLVPPGQSVVVNTIPVKECSSVAGFDWCRVKFIQNTTKIEVEGIHIVEVATIQDALKYFHIQI